MSSLESDHLNVYRKFKAGFHNVRGSNRLWTGLSTDLVIGQVLMRSLKTSGGLARGRDFDIMTGVHVESSQVNVEKARNVGQSILDSMTGKPAQNTHLQRVTKLSHSVPSNLSKLMGRRFRWIHSCYFSVLLFLASLWMR